MTDLPERLSVDPTSPYHDADLLQQGVRIFFKGKERFDVEEYHRGENWIRVALGKKVDRHGRPLTIKLTGPVEVRAAGGEAGSGAATNEE